MPASVSVKVDTASVDKLMAQIDRARGQLGKGMKEAMQWGGVFLAKSLAARTAVSAKRRDVVELPIQRVTKAGEADKRYARFGVKKWVRGVEVVRPLVRPSRGAKPYATISEAKKDRRTIIGRRGLGKKSWSVTASRMITGGTVAVMGVLDAASVEWSGGYVNPSVRLTNRLRYMEHALDGGFSAVQSALDAAANKMEHEITRKVEAAFA